MTINVEDGSRLVEVWLTKAEARDNALREKLAPLYREYKSKKYLVAVYQSGTEELCGLTQDLLRYNRRRSAQIAVERERLGRCPS